MNAPPTGKTLTVRVPGEAVGERLDRFLVAHLDGVTRAGLARWIRDRRVRIDGDPAAKAGLPRRRQAAAGSTPSRNHQITVSFPP